MVRARIIKNAVNSRGGFTANTTVDLTKQTFEDLKSGGYAMTVRDWLKMEAAKEGYAIVRQGRRGPFGRKAA